MGLWLSVTVFQWGFSLVFLWDLLTIRKIHSMFNMVILTVEENHSGIHSAATGKKRAFSFSFEWLRLAHIHSLKYCFVDGSDSLFTSQQKCGTACLTPSLCLGLFYCLLVLETVSKINNLFFLLQYAAQTVQCLPCISAEIIYLTLLVETIFLDRREESVTC